MGNKMRLECVITLFLVSCHVSPIVGQFGHYGPVPYSFENKEQGFLKLQQDPIQARPTKPTPNNLFNWLNLRNAVKFRLWTRKNPHLAQELRFNDPQSVRSSNFDATVLTKIIVHGYADGASEVQIGNWIVEMKDAYLTMADVNLIAVDYAPLASFFLYFTAVPEMVGERLAEMIKFLQDKHKLELGPLHIVGWSWGAQIAGLAGSRLEGQIGRITGIDPAGPTFKYVDDEFRLDKTDAKFVDVIHVNGGKLLFWGYYGLEDSIGHVDIFPNGGRKQIGCPVERTLIYETLWCSHGRGVRYYTESILSPVAFPACRCSSFDGYVKGACPCDAEKDIIYMGEHLSVHSPPGNYYLITRAKEPYGHGVPLNVSLVSNVKTSKNDTSPAKIQEKVEIRVKKFAEKAKIGSRSDSADTDHFLMLNTYNSLYYPNDDILKLSLALTTGNSTKDRDDAVVKLKNVERMMTAIKTTTEVRDVANQTTVNSTTLSS